MPLDLSTPLDGKSSAATETTELLSRIYTKPANEGQIYDTLFGKLTSEANYRYFRTFWDVMYLLFCEWFVCH